MNNRKPLTSEEISAIVDGLNPIDWAQVVKALDEIGAPYMIVGDWQ